MRIEPWYSGIVELSSLPLGHGRQLSSIMQCCDCVCARTMIVFTTVVDSIITAGAIDADTLEMLGGAAELK